MVVFQLWVDWVAVVMRGGVREPCPQWRARRGVELDHAEAEYVGAVDVVGHRCRGPVVVTHLKISALHDRDDDGAVRSDLHPPDRGIHIVARQSIEGGECGAPLQYPVSVTLRHLGLVAAGAFCPHGGHVGVPIFVVLDPVGIVIPGPGCVIVG